MLNFLNFQIYPVYRLFSIRLLYLMVLTGLSVHLVFGQVEENWKHFLTEKLDSDKEVEHLQLVGYFNTYFFAQMRFAYNSDHWVGFIRFPDENVRYDLDGGYVNNDLILLEYDMEDQHIGYWTIKRDREKFLCTWQNPNGTMSHEIEMFDENWNPGLKRSYSQQINTYEGKFGNMPLEIAVHKNMTDNTEIFIFDPRARKPVEVNYQCLNNSCNDVSLEFINMTDKRLNYKLNVGRDKLDLFSLNGGREVNSFTFRIMNRNKTKFHTVMDEYYFLAVEYPELNDPAAQMVINDIYQKIVHQLRSQLDTLTKQEKDVNNRLTLFGITWFEVNYWDKDYISGKWITQKSWNDEVETTLINYSIRNRREIDFQNQFNSDFDFKFYVDHFIEDQKRELPEFRDPLSRNLIMESNFELLNFNQEGILLSSPYNTIFGQFELVIEYDQIEQHLRKRSDLKKLLEKN